MARERGGKGGPYTLLGMLAGGAIGAGVALVYTPGSGEENRRRIAEWVNARISKVTSRVETQAGEIRSKVETQAEEIRGKVEAQAGEIRGKVEAKAGELRDTAHAQAEKVRDKAESTSGSSPESAPRITTGSVQGRTEVQGEITRFVPESESTQEAESGEERQ